MNGILHLSIEIGPRCNLWLQHDKCPRHLMMRDRELLPVERIAEIIRTALDMGFGGYVGFHFYNEPTLYNHRIAQVIDLVPEARYMLITNGYAHPDERIEWVYASPYALGPNYPWDTRLRTYDSGQENSGPCWRPMVECAIDYSGQMALCCQDWMLNASPADVSEGDIRAAFEAWMARAQSVTRGICPPVCKTCTGRQSYEEYRSTLSGKGM